VWTPASVAWRPDSQRQGSLGYAAPPVTFEILQKLPVRALLVASLALGAVGSLDACGGSAPPPTMPQVSGEPVIPPEPSRLLVRAVTQLMVGAASDRTDLATAITILDGQAWLLEHSTSDLWEELAEGAHDGRMETEEVARARSELSKAASIVGSAVPVGLERLHAAMTADERRNFAARLRALGDLWPLETAARGVGETWFSDPIPLADATNRALDARVGGAFAALEKARADVVSSWKGLGDSFASSALDPVRTRTVGEAFRVHAEAEATRDVLFVETAMTVLSPAERGALAAHLGYGAKHLDTRRR
jgi:hypothetical protein